MANTLSKIEIEETEKINVHASKPTIEQELRAMTREALIIRLNFEENDPKIAKLIKKILKEKDHE